VVVNWFRGGIFACGGLNVFPGSARTKGPVDKRGPQLDLARRIGLEPILTEFLIVSYGGNTEGRRHTRGIFYWRNFERFRL
jgi:hypothetical protein